MFAWLWRLFNGTSKTPAQPQGVDETRVDNEVREKVVRNRRAVPAKKSNTSAKPKRVRSDNASKTGRKSPRKAVCATASKGKAKGKVLPKG